MNDQSYQDDGNMRDVRMVEFDSEGNMGDARIVIGQATTYADALAMAHAAGYTVAPEHAGYDIGHIASQDGLDAYGISVLV